MLTSQTKLQSLPHGNIAVSGHNRFYIVQGLPNPVDQLASILIECDMRPNAIGSDKLIKRYHGCSIKQVTSEMITYN